MGEGDQRGEMVFATSREHATIVVELGVGELALGRFDARPFDGKAVAVEAQFGEHRDVLRVEMIMVASVAGGFAEHSVWNVFERPKIAGDIVAFHLMACGSAAPEELVGKGLGFVGRGRCACVRRESRQIARNEAYKSGGGSLRKRTAGERR